MRNFLKKVSRELLGPEVGGDYKSGRTHGAGGLGEWASPYAPSSRWSTDQWDVCVGTGDRALKSGTCGLYGRELEWVGGAVG